MTDNSNMTVKPFYTAPLDIQYWDFNVAMTTTTHVVQPDLPIPLLMTMTVTTTGHHGCNDFINCIMFPHIENSEPAI